MKDTFFSAYMQDLNIIKENIDDPKKTEDLGNVDELTEENTTTIEECGGDAISEDQDQTKQPMDNTISEDDAEIEDTEDDADGWSEDVVEICGDIISQFDDFAYELRNCVKGSFTGAKNQEELCEYLAELKEKIDYVINDLSSK